MLVGLGGSDGPELRFNGRSAAGKMYAKKPTDSGLF